jgi:hypothetical protein
VKAAVKISKADLVATETNLRREYGSFAELEQALHLNSIRPRSVAVTLMVKRPQFRSASVHDQR